MYKYRRNTAYKVLYHLLFAEDVQESGVSLSPLTPEDPQIRRVALVKKKAARHLRLSSKRLDEGLEYLHQIGLLTEFLRESSGKITVDLSLPKGHTTCQ